MISLFKSRIESKTGNILASHRQYFKVITLNKVTILNFKPKKKQLKELLLKVVFYNYFVKVSTTVKETTPPVASE